MGYIYEEVRKLMNGLNKPTGSGLITNWTPNSYRCIVVGGSFIFIARHVGSPIVRLLDVSKVQEDLAGYARGVGKGSLHNLLSGRQLSCLEEIYFDGIYKQYRNLYDMNMYISKVKNSLSRLRYYGYFSADYTGITSWLTERYMNCGVLYCLASDSSCPLRLESVSVGDTDWYKHYNLRPQYYKMDSEKGTLAIYFRKNEDKIEKMIAEAKKSQEEKEKGKETNDKNALIKEALMTDIRNYEYLVKLKTLAIYCFKNKKDEICDSVYKNLMKLIEKSPYTYITPRKVESSLMNEVDASVVNGLMSYYKKFRVIGEDSKSMKSFDPSGIDIGDLRKAAETGFSRVEEILDKLCCGCTRDISHIAMHKVLLDVNKKRAEKLVPMGEFYTTYIGSGTPVGNVGGYLTYLSYMVGYNLDRECEGKF